MRKGSKNPYIIIWQQNTLALALERLSLIPQMRGKRSTSKEHITGKSVYEWDLE